ncbi:hypothetical protein ACOSP7_031917 [Xanthoceras sorbifolium]
MKISSSSNIFSMCDSCRYGKMHQLPFPRSTIKTKKPLDLSTQIFGVLLPVFSAGYRYYIVFVDCHTRFSLLYPLSLKSEALATFFTFKKQVELQFNTKICTLQTDMGQEFKVFGAYLKSVGIFLRFSYAYTHQQNSVAERKHRHIVETGLTLLAHASMSLTFMV